MLKIDNLSLRIRNKEILKNISFEVRPKEIFALCGDSGSGKTLTSLSVLNLVSDAVYPTGGIFWEGKNLLTLKAQQMRKIRSLEIGYIFQEPTLALNPVRTIGFQLSEVFTLHGKPVNKDILRALMQQVGFYDADLNSYPHQLSGGQKQRIVIAMAIALKPKLIIADEPTAALDRYLQSQFIKLLRNIKGDSSILLINHDMSVVEKLADRIAVIKEGEIIETNDKEALFKNPQHDYTKLLIEADTLDQPIKVTGDEAVVFRAERIEKYYTEYQFLWKKTQKHVLEDISFSIKKGHSFGIIGESGSGKTTLARIIVRLETLSSGKFFFHNQDISTGSFKGFRQKIQYVFQDPYVSFNPKMTIYKILREGLDVHFPGIGDQVILDILEAIDMPKSILNRYPHEFSGGQRQRIAIARAVLLQPELLILDEPTSALDRTVQKKIMILLRKLQEEKNLTYLFISHDLKLIRSICHDVLVLKEGKIVEYGETSAVFANPQHPYTKLLIENMF